MSSFLRLWDAWIAKRHLDAGVTHYPTSVALLPERMSEMFHFDRRAYLLHPSLGQAIFPLLDVIHAEGDAAPVDLVVNRGGVFHGYTVQWTDHSVDEIWDCIAECRT